MIYLLIRLLDVFQLVLFVYVILSWFPLRYGGFPQQIQETLRRIINPILEPIRRRVPPFGPFDSSFLILIIGIWLLRAFLFRLSL